MPEAAANSPSMTRPFLLVGAVAAVLIAATLGALGALRHRGVLRDHRGRNRGLLLARMIPKSGNRFSDKIMRKQTST